MRNLKTFYLGALFSVLPVLLTAGDADTLYSAGKKTAGTVLSIEKEDPSTGFQVKFSRNGKAEQAQGVTLIEFDAPVVEPKQQAVILKSGTMLGGAIRINDKTHMVIRTTAFGLLDIPSDEVAGLITAMDSVPAALPLAEIAPGVILKDGTAVSGKILWRNEKNVAVSTKKGLKKFAPADVAAVLFLKPDAGRKLVLRNGDIINETLTFQGESIQTGAPLLKNGTVTRNSVKRLEAGAAAPKTAETTPSTKEQIK